MDDLARFCCLNPGCNDHGRRGGNNLRVHSRYVSDKRYRILECRTCGHRAPASARARPCSARTCPRRRPSHSWSTWTRGAASVRPGDW